jgi:hypothetical protein
MFIVHYGDGKTITENDMIWNDVPDGITNLQLSLPVVFKIKDNKTGEVKEGPAPTVTLGKYDAYYFENEAVAIALVSSGGEMKAGQSQENKVAQIISGIDYQRNIVVQIRIDKFANVAVSRFPLEQFKRVEKYIKKGQ